MAFRPASVCGVVACERLRVGCAYSVVGRVELVAGCVARVVSKESGS